MTSAIGKVCLFATLVAAQTGALFGQRGSRLWRPEERVVVADFSSIDAVAADDNTLYLVAPDAILMYDRRFFRWQPPVTAIDGYPRMRASSAVVDPTDGSLWIAGDVGVVSYTPFTQRLDVVSLPGGAMELMFDAEEAFAGIYVRDRVRWQFLPRGGVVTHPASRLPPVHQQIRPLTVSEALERFPFVRTARALVLTDERMRSYRYTAAAHVRDTDELFLGTDGLGAVRFDVQTTEVERLQFGLLADAASALVSVKGGVWVGTGPDSRRVGFTFVSEDLQQFEYEQGPRSTGFPAGEVRDLVERDGLWAATDDGLIRVDGDRLRITSRDGLPGGRVLRLAASTKGLWVGAERGLAIVRADGSVARVSDVLVDPVTALAARGDTAWVGTPRGLGLARWGENRVVVPGDVAATPEFRDGVVALTVVGDALVVATRDRIVWRDLIGDGEESESPWRVERAIASELGDLTGLAAGDRAVWIGGTRGVAFYRFATRAFTFFNDPGDLPGIVRDLAVSGEYLWVGTDEGLVRFRRSSLVP